VASRDGRRPHGNRRGALTRDGEEDPQTDAKLAVAQLPTVAAAYWRAREGEDPVEPREDLGHAANYLYMLDGEEASEERVRGLETYLNSVVDHGLNASTFTARTIVSTESDVVSAVTGAVGALKGPLHGGAPGPVLDMLRDAQAADDPAGLVRDILDSGERVMGFGHRVYDVRDPGRPSSSRPPNRSTRAVMSARSSRPPASSRTPLSTCSPSTGRTSAWRRTSSSTPPSC